MLRFQVGTANFPSGFGHRTSVVAITCNGANRVCPRQYLIKAIGYGGVEDTLQKDSLYLLKGRLIPKNDVKDPATDKHEFFFEAPFRLLVGTTNTFPSDLHDSVGVTGLGIVLSKTSIFEDSVQPKAVKEGKAEKKKTNVIIVRHGDYHPIVSLSVYSCFFISLLFLYSLLLTVGVFSCAGQ